MEEKVSGEISSVEVDSLDEGTLDEPVLVTIVRYFWCGLLTEIKCALRMSTEKGLESDYDKMLLRTCSQKEQGASAWLWGLLYSQESFSCLHLPHRFLSSTLRGPLGAIVSMPNTWSVRIL